MSEAINLSEIETEATTTAVSFMESADSWIDGQFGAGYAEKHPTLVAGFMQACAIVYLAERVSGIDGIAGAVATLGDLLATRLDTLDDAVDGLLERERGEAAGVVGGEGAP